MTLPYFIHTGSPYEKGFAIGSTFASRIRLLVERNKDWEASQKAIPQDLIERVCRRFLSWCERLCPSLIDEAEGCARGAGVDGPDIIKMNANGEIRASIPGDSSGCTAFALDSSVTGGPHLSGQSKDGAGPLWKYYVVMDTQNRGEPRILELAYPGYFGLLGLSETGMSLFTNRIFDGVKTDGLPHIILKRLIWQCRYINEVEALIAEHGTAIAANLLVCDIDGHAACFELKGGSYARIDSDDGILLHTNHFLKLSGHEDEAAIDAVRSKERLQRLLTLVKREKGRIDQWTIFRLYRDHRYYPRGICSHGTRNEDYGTTAVMVAAPQDRMLSVSAGRTCRARFTTYQMGQTVPVLVESGALT